MSIENRLFNTPVSITYLHAKEFYAEREVPGGLRRFCYHNKFFYFEITPIEKLHTKENPWYFYSLEFVTKRKT